MDLAGQQRSVIRFYCLRGKTNAQIEASLKKGYGVQALRTRTIEKWAARFRGGRFSVEDDSRPGRPIEIDLKTAVLKALDRQPHSSSREISKVLGFPKTTVLRALEELGLRFFESRWIPFRLSNDQKADRVRVSQEMIMLLEGLGPIERQYLITGDESWIYWDNGIRGMWAMDRDHVDPSVKHMISSRKTMVSVYFSRRGIVSLEFLPQGQTYNSQFFTDTVLASIDNKLAETRPKKRSKGAHLHVDNARPHTARASVQRIAELGLIRVPHPPYSPDIAPCDFFLFGYMKGKLEGCTFETEDQVISTVTEILGEITIPTFERVMDNWVTRLIQCYQLSGEYPP
jgi:histone-lysine N-methyltransferase SETMAR